MLLEDGPLGLRQGRRLAQQVLRKGELAEVVKAPRELCELELFTGEADARGQSNRKLGDTLRVIPAVDVSGIDGTCKTRRSSQPRHSVIRVDCARGRL